MEVLKTVKMYVGGEFIRSESGETTPFYNIDGSEFARVCIASRKDFRNAIEKAKTSSWSKASNYLRGQILYRCAEMAQGKFSELENILINIIGLTKEEASNEVQDAIDTFVYYAGWSDKYQQAISTVNPVNGPYHNFTSTQEMGVVVLIDSNKFSLSKLIDNICSIIVSGNNVVAFVSGECSPIVTTLGEIFATSDMPCSTVNLLSGNLESLKSHIATHMEVNAISFQNEDEELYSFIRKSSIDNMKRIIPLRTKEKSLDLIMDFVEHKTLWHPIGY